MCSCIKSLQTSGYVCGPRIDKSCVNCLWHPKPAITSDLKAQTWTRAASAALDYADPRLKFSTPIAITLNKLLRAARGGLFYDVIRPNKPGQ